MGMAVVFISFAGWGRPEAGLSDLEIHHLVSVASWEDIVADENRADWQALAALCGITLMKASLSNDFRLSRVDPTETPGSGLP
jgi:hypothetical protein